MSRTGGGRGTNQHKIKGVGVRKDNTVDSEPTLWLGGRVSRYGETPVPADELQFLVPQLSSLRTMKDVDDIESLSISNAADDFHLASMRPQTILQSHTLRSLHRAMLEAVWTWAGQYRSTEVNIGNCPPEQISDRLEQLLGNLRWRVDNSAIDPAEACAVLHHGLGQIHPFRNGNGRHARLAADLLATSLDLSLPEWGTPGMDNEESDRKEYLSALHEADKGKILPLLSYMWEPPRG